MAAFLLLPVLTLLVQGLSPQAWHALGQPAVQGALRVSALTTLCSLALILALGTPVAYLLARRRFPGHLLLDALLDLPMVLPPVVAGLALLLTFGRQGWLGAPLELAGVSLAFSPAAVVLAQVFTAAPFYVRAARAGFTAFDPDVEAAARVDGAGRQQVLAQVTLPLALPFLLEGAVLAWARALGEFGATLLFAGSLQGTTRTMPLAIYGALESDLAPALTLSALLIMLAFGVLLTLRALAARRPSV
ncbi:ABC transporter permease [Deinococcus hohokamensis]|uniref:Molybdenum transport system permease n=1 Tax=Deinococcus hohokamensis TaxID=309883 RepID=A0ABV9I7E9_9DEIO